MDNDKPIVSSLEKLYNNIKDNLNSLTPTASSDNEQKELSMRLPLGLTAEKIDQEIKKIFENETGIDRIKKLVAYEWVSLFY